MEGLMTIIYPYPVCGYGFIDLLIEGLLLSRPQFRCTDRPAYFELGQREDNSAFSSNAGPGDNESTIFPAGTTEPSFSASFTTRFSCYS